MSIVLPTEKTPPVSDLSRFTILIHGLPKIGKSTWCASMPNALFLATEPGLNSLEAYQIPIKSGDDIKEVYSLLKSEKGKKFKTVIIDTVDIFYNMCTQKVCEEYDVKYEGDLGYGKGFSLAQAKFKTALSMFAILPQGLVLISHSQEMEVETRTGKYKKMIPTLPGKAGKIVTGLVDIILYFDVETKEDKDGKKIEERVVKTKFNKHYEAGDRTGVLPKTVPMDYGIFEKAFNDGMAKKESKRKKENKKKEWKMNDMNSVIANTEKTI